VKFAQKKIAKNLLIFTLLAGGLLFARLLFAQDFGTDVVNNSLNGSLGNQGSDPRTIITNIINIALGFLGLIALGIIIWGGFVWMTSNGDEEKVSKAKQILKDGVIGLAIILSSWAIATFLITTFGGGGPTPPPPNGCVTGETQQCGCGWTGTMICTNGAWGACMGASSEGCTDKPLYCSNFSSSCQPNDNICSADDYCNNVCLCKPKGQAGDPCDSDTSTATCDANNNLCSEYLTCDPNTCLCAGPPVITAISPLGGFCNSNINQTCTQDSDCGAGNACDIVTPNGAANNFITISGKNFGAYSTTSSKVIFLGSGSQKDGVLPATINSACTNFWRDDQIIIAVPAGVQNGAIEVINRDNLIDSTSDNFGPKIPDFVVNNISRPGLCSIDPTQGTLNSEINYQGISLYQGTAYFGNYKSNVSGLYSTFTNSAGLSGTSTTPNIQAGTSGSFVQTVISGSSQKSNYLKFEKIKEAGDGPYIMSFSPAAGPSGQYVTVKGAGFGGTKGTNDFYFVSGPTKIKAAYTFPAICANSVWNDNQIIVKVPDGIPDNDYQLVVAIGATEISTKDLHPNTFKVDSTLHLTPSLCKMDPEQGAIDTPVTLWGEYFGKAKADGIVQFNFEKKAPGKVGVEKDGANIINAAVPKEAITGPVKVVNSFGAGNELNFKVSECIVDADCNNQVCCPQNTYRKGRCVGDITECFIDIPTSVYEWSFSTAFDASVTPPFSSCLGASKYFGSCFLGATCPNSPGACSSPSTGTKKNVGSCDITCNNVPGCTALTCTYNPSLDKCVKGNSIVDDCNLSESKTFLPADYSEAKPEKSVTTQKTCKSNGTGDNTQGHWEIISPGSCPIGWTRGVGNICVQDNSTCSLCSTSLTCEKIGQNNKCVSGKLCAGQASCVDNTVNTQDDCILDVLPSCDCCCRKAHAAQDCCAPLTCEGKCGLDLTANSNTYGSCSGCAAIGTTVAEHDAACNCTGSSGKYCDTNASLQGICSDCAGLSDQTNCGNHSSACCYDSNKTEDIKDDYCRGVASSSVVSTISGNPNYGYCAYFKCKTDNPLLCASTTPSKIGVFANVNTCISDCPKGPDDRCKAFNNNKDACSKETGCCYNKIDNKCKSGIKISSTNSSSADYSGSADYPGNPNYDYCAYYNCNTDGATCNKIATTTGRFTDVNLCGDFCENPWKGAGQDCADATSTANKTCNTGLCTVEGFKCWQDTGVSTTSVPGFYPSCGTCCCQPGLATDSCFSTSTPLLHCKADQDACSGASRGLCCGCSKDSDCGSETTTGCGSDTCCQARPNVVSTLPHNNSTNVCRNSSIKITFNQSMDTASFANNFLLFEEQASSNSVCPVGTYLTDARTVKELINAPSKNIFVRLWESVSGTIKNIFSPNKNNQALAAVPSSNKLYCAIAGVVSSEQGVSTTSLIFTPSKALAAGTVYFGVVKGDELLNSQTGVLSSAEIGMNNTDTNQNIFNGRNYHRSYSFSFTTLSEQGGISGICAIDHTSISPSSYLFKTTVNDLNEKDNNAEDKSFDTVADRDKVFSVNAYSSDNQILIPVNGYSWEWLWVTPDFKIASMDSVPNLKFNRKLVTAKSGVTDGQTQISAMVDMGSFNPAKSSCSNSNTCNVIFAGDEFKATSDIYVFLCNNPWPKIDSNGNWSPWNDGSSCSGGITPCESYNYKFYYCRDAGGPGTLDDLPSINNAPVNRGGSLLCSLDNSSCPKAGDSCGTGGQGICYWSILKESYFFREADAPQALGVSAVDTFAGGEVEVSWKAPSSGINAFKVYYLKANQGQGTMLSKDVSLVSACPIPQNYSCSAKINGLTDGQLYIFKVTTISTNNVESPLSNEAFATSSNKTAPLAPTNLIISNLSTTTVRVSWSANAASENVSFYRLYRGSSSGLYGESFDSAVHATTTTLNNTFSGKNYFALTAINNSNKESVKSIEKVVNFVNGLIAN
jgi:hypothetical protein